MFGNYSVLPACSAHYVPGQILVAFVTELTVYGFGFVEGHFAEFLSILENRGATGLDNLPRALRVVGIGRAKQRDTYLRGTAAAAFFFLAC